MLLYETAVDVAGAIPQIIRIRNSLAVLFDSTLKSLVVDMYAKGDHEDMYRTIKFMVKRNEAKWFVENLVNKIINIHPSLLPSFKGANAVLDALKAGVKITGCTTHFVTEEMDDGPIIMQSSVEVSAEDDFKSLSEKILMHEHKIYPETLKNISKKLLNSL